jgi:hypothetical protein
MASRRSADSFGNKPENLVWRSIPLFCLSSMLVVLSRRRWLAGKANTARPSGRLSSIQVASLWALSPGAYVVVVKGSASVCLDDTIQSGLLLLRRNEFGEFGAGAFFWHSRSSTGRPGPRSTAVGSAFLSRCVKRCPTVLPISVRRLLVTLLMC